MYSHFTLGLAIFSFTELRQQVLAVCFSSLLKNYGGFQVALKGKSLCLGCPLWASVEHGGAT